SVNCIVLNCPQTTNVQCAADVPAPATDLATFTSQGGSASFDTETCSSCAGTVITVTWVSDVITDSNCPNHFTMTRTYKATAGCTPTFTTCTQTITVNDTMPPILGPCPATITITASSAAGAIVYYTKPSATDNC